MSKMGDACKLGSLGDLGQTVRAHVGFGQGGQRRGHWCSHHRHFGVVCRALGSIVDDWMDAAVTAFVGCREAHLAPALPLAPFHPPYASQPLYLSSNAMSCFLPHPSFVIKLSPPLPPLVVVLLVIAVIVVVDIGSMSRPLVADGP